MQACTDIVIDYFVFAVLLDDTCSSTTLYLLYCWTILTCSSTTLYLRYCRMIITFSSTTLYLQYCRTILTFSSTTLYLLYCWTILTFSSTVLYLMHYWTVQSNPFISRLLEAKIRECKLSGSPVISQAQRPRLVTCRINRPTLWRLQLSNSMLSDDRGTHVSLISTHIDITPATNHNKQH